MIDKRVTSVAEAVADIWAALLLDTPHLAPGIRTNGDDTPAPGIRKGGLP